MRVVSIHSENHHSTSASAASAYAGHDVLCITLQEGLAIGRGYAVANTPMGETTASLLAEARAIKPVLELELCRDRHQLLALLPPGGVRQAVDFAFLDLHDAFVRPGFWRRAGLRTRQSAPVSDLTHLPWRVVAQQVLQARSGNFRVAIESANDLQRLLRLSQHFPQFGWLLVLADDVDIQQHEHALAALPRRSVIAIELSQSQFWRARLLSSLTTMPLSVADNASPNNLALLAEADCQYISLDAQTSGGLTYIEMRLKDTALQGIGVILSNTDVWQHNTHATAVIASLADWVCARQHTIDANPAHNSTLAARQSLG